MTITPNVGAGGRRRFCGRCAGDGDLGPGHGRKGLLVLTPDGVREPQNRRVEIVIQ
jgi:hypothetical protein